MAFFTKLKKVFFEEDTINQEFVIEEMNRKIEELKEEYQKIIDIQKSIMENPQSIFNYEFSKKEKYIELMDSIKYKDINLIKDYEYLGIKYNILIELYNKLKEFIKEYNNEVLIDFETDKYKQPVAILAPYNGGLHKILLIKNTFSQPDFIKYTIDYKNIIIEEIVSKEPNVHHGKFMMQMLFKTSKFFKENKYNNLDTIILSKNIMENLNKSNNILFFEKLGFTKNNKELSKKIVWK